MYGSFKDHLTKELETIKENGLFKRERIITTEQGAVVKVSTGESASSADGDQSDKEVIIFCANKIEGAT